MKPIKLLLLKTYASHKRLALPVVQSIRCWCTSSDAEPVSKYCSITAIAANASSQLLVSKLSSAITWNANGWYGSRYGLHWTFSWCGSRLKPSRYCFPIASTAVASNCGSIGVYKFEYSKFSYSCEQP